jgi:transcriptional regulator with XRE-family HTH domain
MAMNPAPNITPRAGPDSPPEHASASLEFVTERLRHARLRAGIAQRFGVADRFGWDYPTYVAHERGQVSLSLMAAKQYAKGFGVSVEWLLYGIGEMDRRERPRTEATVDDLREEVERLTRENAALLVLLKSGALTPD